ncbi:collagen-binding domain-containing protein [Lactiplantibacillus plantarum]|uniref:collagen-binding domain-containing protein n=1 Tax=Lactiplantibacillus plantarum TaxID=1590 RepID=UPI00244E01B6|nr:collagen-binding domain-containing protein [Lactiplantibacillus plantarum]MCG0737598.1 cell surface protein [Lactiplantibacillus plantarum]MDN7030107.1 choice-of-anchor A family protein [Lactiplantibacillus plantarum]WGI45276.1 choice-of-anchor A family protein [Lactiplantibacillus plantarum]
MERKRTNFKMYKIGRRWAFACAVILTMGTTTLVARADDGTTATGTDTASTSSSTTKSVTAKTQTLKTAATTEADVTNQNQPVLDTDGSNSKTAAGTVAGTKAATDTDTNATTNLDETTSANTETGSDTTAGSKTAKETNATTGSESTKETSTTTDSATATAARTTTSSNKGATTDSATSNDTAATAAKTTDASAKIAGTTTSDSVAQQTTTTKDQSTTTATPQTVAVALSQAVTHANDAVADGGNVTDDYPDLHNMLGVSSQFHIFAREAELHAHTNGNVAVQNLVGNVNFGTNIIEELLDKDISYIQNISNIAGSSFVSAGETRSNKVIFGENIEIDVSNPNRPMVNGVYIDHLLASEVYQDKDGNVYIDFDKEFAKLEKLSASLSEASANATYTSDSFEDMNQRVIDVTDMQPDADGHIVINLSADVLNTSTPLTIKGLSADADGNTVIINVDTAGATNYQVNSQIKIIYDDGTERNNKETEDFGDNHLLWNFYDSTASDKLATGVISVDRPFQGSILAPAAEIDANQNIDGNIIANKVNVKAETHRWDLQDNVDNENDPEPVPDYEKPVHPSIDAELPDGGEGEEPEYDKPVHPSIDIEMPDNGEEEEEYDKPVHPSIDVEMPDFDEIEDEEEAEDAEEEFEDDIEDEIEAGVTPDEVVDQIEEEVDNEITADWVTDETATELETAFEEVQKEAVVGDQIKDEETLINLIDRAIAQAKAHHNTALVAQLQALRTKVASALAVAKGQALPQTDEAPSQMISLAGIALASTLVLGAAAVSRRKRQY